MHTEASPSKVLHEVLKEHYSQCILFLQGQIIYKKTKTNKM